MYSYEWDASTGGYILIPTPLTFSKEPRPVYYKELDILGFDQYWTYDKNDSYPYMWAEASNYYYRGRLVAKTKGGSFYHKPEIVLIEDPEPTGYPLRFVDIPAMVEKNKEILEQLIQETIKKIYNNYVQYKNKVDLFYVAFSGGKDSVVTLDLVQRALPHNEFKVLFGDTGMEFSDTYEVIHRTKAYCAQNNIEFFIAKSKLTPEYTWNTIGPPAQKMRWCCSVHKTAPQILLLRKITNNPHFRGMAMMGVRGDESVTRSKYDEINFGTKHRGQYDFYPIFNWNSAELFLYIYQEKLLFNETYKWGNSRAGCLVCPMEATKNTWYKEQLYSGSINDSQTTSFYNNIILNQTIAKELSPEKKKEFMDIGVWKSRHNWSKLISPHDIYKEKTEGETIIISLDEILTDWREWLKTVGELQFASNDEVYIFHDKYKCLLKHSEENNKHIFRITNISHTQAEINFASWVKIALRKAGYCITCQVCEANCPNGYIHMKDGNVTIDDKCTKCKKCYTVDNGCLVSASQRLPKERNKMNGSIDQYKNMGIQYQWVIDYLTKRDQFWTDNQLGSMMITALNAFLRHAGVSERKKITAFGNIVADQGGDSEIAWALMLCNLVYTPQFYWWVKNIHPYKTYTQPELFDMLKDDLTNNSTKNAISGFKNIFSTNPVLSERIGFGIVSVERKGKNTFLIDAQRTSWSNPDERVILYSLYKFAEACGNYKQFTLTRLLDHDVESDGISPTQIFGLDRDTMEKILNGLTFNYPDLIEARFTLGLDNITLKSDKTAAEVLDELF